MVAEALDPVWGGVAEGVYQQSRELVRLGHAVECLSAEPCSVARFAEDGIPHHAMRPADEKYRKSAETSVWLAQNLDRFDHVILNGMWSHPILAAAEQAAQAGKTAWLMPHGMLDPYFKQGMKKKLVKSAYWTLHGRRILSACRGLLFTTTEEERLARSAYDLASRPGYVVGYGIVDPLPLVPEGSELLDRFGLQPGGYHLFMSRLHPKKGLSMLLEAMLQTGHETPLVIAGDDTGPYARELKQIVDGAPAGQFLWTGFLKGAEKWTLLQHCQTMMLPSHQENFGVIVAETLALGRPALVTKKVNTWPLVERYNAGWVCEDTTESLAACLGQPLPADSQPRQCFEENFTIEACTARLVQTLEAA